MKKQSTSSRKRGSDDLRAEYEFSTTKGGVRGKYYKGYREGHRVVVHKADGTAVVQHFKLVDGAVVLDPKVRKYFRNSTEVNRALMGLIELMPHNRQARTKGD